jgi:hypothetical protein
MRNLLRLVGFPDWAGLRSGHDRGHPVGFWNALA